MKNKNCITFLTIIFLNLFFSSCETESVDELTAYEYAILVHAVIGGPKKDETATFDIQYTHINEFEELIQTEKFPTNDTDSGAEITYVITSKSYGKAGVILTSIKNIISFNISISHISSINEELENIDNEYLVNIDINNPPEEINFSYDFSNDTYSME